MKKITIIFVIIGVLGVSAYVFVRHALGTPGFTPEPAKDTTVATQTSTSILDLRPKLVKKLQELVKQGSGGLYNLSIHEIEPDILNERLVLSKSELIPDSVVWHEMIKNKKAPDDVFRFTVDSIRIEGIGLRDIFSTDHIKLQSIHISKPLIDVYHQKRSYNKKNDTATLYQQLVKQLTYFSTDTIIIDEGTVVNHNLEKNKETKFNDVNMRFFHLLIDSSTQFDKDRFLFAKQAFLSMKNYSLPTTDGLYNVKIGDVSISAPHGLVTAKNISMLPKYDRAGFEKKVGTQQEMYKLSISSIQFANMDWWALANNDNLIADEATISSTDFSVYLDRTLPSGAPSVHDFPHQLIMRLPLKINIAKIKVQDLNLVYEEFNPKVERSGKLFVDHLHGEITNLTNMASAIKKNGKTNIRASGLIMHSVPADLTIAFDLIHYKSGNFTAGLETKGFDGTIINPVAEPVALFSIKRGNAKKISSHISGDNYKASGKVLFLYDGLHITPMKPGNDRESGLKKKSVTSLLANKILIKDENPHDGATRNAIADFTRDPHGSFFNLIWKTTFVGILRTIGAPDKLAY